MIAGAWLQLEQGSSWFAHGGYERSLSSKGNQASSSWAGRGATAVTRGLKTEDPPRVGTAVPQNSCPLVEVADKPQRTEFTSSPRQGGRPPHHADVAGQGAAKRKSTRTSWLVNTTSSNLGAAQADDSRARNACPGPTPRTSQDVDTEEDNMLFVGTGRRCAPICGSEFRGELRDDPAPSGPGVASAAGPASTGGSSEYAGVGNDSEQCFRRPCCLDRPFAVTRARMT